MPRVSFVVENQGFHGVYVAFFVVNIDNRADEKAAGAFYCGREKHEKPFDVSRACAAENKSGKGGGGEPSEFV